jgi:DNA-binding NtrC family response regulator
MAMGFDDVTTRLLQAARTTPSVVSQTVTVTVLSGPDSGKTFEIDDLAHRQVLVGKSASCDIRLTDPTASRRHASLELDDAEVWARDLGSSNGTFLEGVRIRDAAIGPGQVLKLGGTSLRFSLGSERREVPASAEGSFGRFVGASPGLRRLYSKLDKLTQLDVPILIEGEAGTGKELMAESIHESGPRAKAPFVIFGQGSLSPAEAEIALFGKEPDGSGPGVTGALEQAQGGTLFLDEVFEIDMPLQLKIVRALEKKSLRKLGAAQAIPLDVRCIAATRRDLDREVGARRFREELLDFFGARIDLPPLRRRRGDVKLLTRYFWARLGGDPARLSDATIARFEENTWPGNVRELAKAVARQLVSEETLPAGAPDVTEASRSPDYIDSVVGEKLAFSRARAKVMAEFEARYLRLMLEAHQGNITRAAAASGVSSRYFYRLKAK